MNDYELGKTPYTYTSKEGKPSQLYLDQFPLITCYVSFYYNDLNLLFNVYVIQVYL